MTPEEKTKSRALAHARRANQSAKDSARRRDESFQRAAQYASLQEIADAVGLSKGRIHQIVQAGKS